MIEFKIKSAKVIAHDEGQVILDLMDKKSIHELKLNEGLKMVGRSTKTA